jgi:hypothetical protein
MLCRTLQYFVVAPATTVVHHIVNSSHTNYNLLLHPFSPVMLLLAGGVVVVVVGQLHNLGKIVGWLYT